MTESVNTRKLKIVLLGCENVGKTSMIKRFVNDSFDNNSSPTVQTGIFTKTVLHETGEPVTLNIYDTAGQERFQSVTPNFYRDADCVIIVFSLIHKDSISRAQDWINEIEATMQDNYLLVIAGNKSDLIDDRQIDFQECVEFAKENKNSLYVECSAKTGVGIYELFFSSYDDALKKQDNVKLGIDIQNSSNSKHCC